MKVVAALVLDKTLYAVDEKGDVYRYNFALNRWEAVGK